MTSQNLGQRTYEWTYVVQCEKCFKWRPTTTKEEYEDIRSRLEEDRFFCENKPNFTCENPGAIEYPSGKTWVFDKFSIPKTPAGFIREVNPRKDFSRLDTVYITPTGKKLKCPRDVVSYLNSNDCPNECKNLDAANFSFARPRLDPDTLPEYAAKRVKARSAEDTATEEIAVQKAKTDEVAFMVDESDDDAAKDVETDGNAAKMAKADGNIRKKAGIDGNASKNETRCAETTPRGAAEKAKTKGQEDTIPEKITKKAKTNGDGSSVKKAQTEGNGAFVKQAEADVSSASAQKSQDNCSTVSFKMSRADGSTASVKKVKKIKKPKTNVDAVDDAAKKTKTPKKAQTNVDAT